MIKKVEKVVLVGIAQEEAWIIIKVAVKEAWIIVVGRIKKSWRFFWKKKRSWFFF